MATLYEIILEHEDREYARQASAACFQLLAEIETDLSRFIENSDISRIAVLKAGERLVLGVHSTACLDRAMAMFRATGGAFNIAYLSAGSADFEGGEVYHLDPQTSVFESRVDGLKLDLGGIGKGYALDCMAELLQEWELDRALLQGGRSSVLALDGPQGEGGWPLSISAPGAGRQLLGRPSLRRQAMAASGLQKGAHIRPPAGRGEEPISAVLATWAIGHPAAEMDAMSTAAMLLDPHLLEECCAALDCTVARLERPAVEGSSPQTQLVKYGPGRERFD